jgi:hypothetical protein
MGRQRDRNRMTAVMASVKERERMILAEARVAKPNVTVVCGSCAAGDHACGGDCSCSRCTGIVNGMEPTP